jgi:hypothetical protein
VSNPALAPKHMKVGYDPRINSPVLVDGEGNPRGIPSVAPEGEDTYTSAYPPAFKSNPILPQKIDHPGGNVEYYKWPVEREGAPDDAQANHAPRLVEG